ncbi:hypothetical protein [uncultured Paracoccus sp.]|uniref:hypothetical protein n=1 Tax=uncultured Paracoccus sp. TaxID=189685 RepID=UPI00259789D7|nr:hypothetical protein [uncultured Paracoccus sp.]
MIEVELPDGTIVEFPDGTSRDVMKAALQKRFGSQRPAKQAEGQGFLNNVAQKAGDGLFFGFGDEISARLNAITGYDANTGTYGNWGTTYDDQLAAVRGQERQFSAEHPFVSLGAEVGGALLPAVAGAGAVAQGGNLLSQIGRGALYGSATGAAYGFGEGEGGAENRLDGAKWNALLGGFVGGAIPAVGAGVRSIAQGRAQRNAIADAARGAPSTGELRAMGNALYQQVDDAGVQISPEAFDRTRLGILDRLRSTTGYDELPGPGSLTPNTARVMSIMDEASNRMAAEPTAALPFRSLDQMRRQAGAAAGNVTNKTDQRAGMAVIEQLDDFVQRLGPDDVVAGDPEVLKSAISKARDVWSRMSKSQIVDDAMERSENYLSGSASGVRNQFRNILQNKKLAAQFTAAEKAALRSVTHGSTLDQLINLAGSGLAQMGSIGGGIAAGGPLGGLAGAGLAAGQRKLAEAVTMRNAERARAAIASGALRNPEVMNALAIAGQTPQRLTNALGLAVAPVATTNALSGR